MPELFNGFELPDLNRGEVQDILEGTPFFGFEDFGDFEMQLLSASVEVGKNPKSSWYKKPYVRAEFLILTAAVEEYNGKKDVTLAPGVKRALGFALNGQKFDDVKLADFIKAVDGVPRATKGYDAVAGLKKVLTVRDFTLPGLPPTVFRFVARPNEVEKEIKNKAGQVLGIDKVVYRQDRFYAKGVPTGEAA